MRPTHGSLPADTDLSNDSAAAKSRAALKVPSATRLAFTLRMRSIGKSRSERSGSAVLAAAVSRRRTEASRPLRTTIPTVAVPSVRALSDISTVTTYEPSGTFSMSALTANGESRKSRGTPSNTPISFTTASGARGFAAFRWRSATRAVSGRSSAMVGEKICSIRIVHGRDGSTIRRSDRTTTELANSVSGVHARFCNNAIDCAYSRRSSDVRPSFDALAMSPSSESICALSSPVGLTEFLSVVWVTLIERMPVWACAKTRNGATMTNSVASRPSGLAKASGVCMR